jgi:hypothetical protein
LRVELNPTSLPCTFVGDVAGGPSEKRLKVRPVPYAPPMFSLCIIRQQFLLVVRIGNPDGKAFPASICSRTPAV